MAIEEREESPEAMITSNRAGTTIDTAGVLVPQRDGRAGTGPEQQAGEASDRAGDSYEWTALSVTTLGAL